MAKTIATIAAKTMTKAASVETEEDLDVAVGPLEIENEDDGSTHDNGTALKGRAPITIRKPEREDWILLRPERAWKARLARIKIPGVFDFDYYSVPIGPMREGLESQLRMYTIVPYFSTLNERFFLYILSLSGANGYADKLNLLFRQAPDWYEEKLVRIAANQERRQYDIFWKETNLKPKWPEEDTGILLGEALGPNRIVATVDHPKYNTIRNTGEVLV